MDVVELKLPALLCIALASSCVVLEPSDGLEVRPEAPVLFRGYASLPGQRITLQARARDGTFETFATTRAGREPQRLEDGSRIYAWRVEAVVPYWRGHGCERTAVIRALGKVLGGHVPLFAYREETAACLRDALDRGTPLVRAMRECAAAAGGTFELHAGDVRVGDVSVTTQAEADALDCVTRIEGSLTVQPNEPLLSLPNLAAVSGDVLIEVEDTTSEMLSPAEVVELPVLANIGGTLRFHHLNGNYHSTVLIGLPALTALHGDLELTLSSSNGDNRGLDALLEVDGDVRITGRGDHYPLDLLQNLRRVAGNLVVQTSGAGSSGGILPRLVQVDGDVELLSLRRMARNSFVELQTVGGRLRLRDTHVGEPTCPQLTRVARGLFLEDNTDPGSPGPVLLGSTSGLSLGALTIANTGLTVIPVPTATRVDTTGPISVHDNVDLCQDTVDDFVTAQQTAGWAGALLVAGNTGTCPP